MLQNRPITNIAAAPMHIIDGDRGNNYPKHADFGDAGHCLFLNTGNVTKHGFNFDQCQFITEEKDSALRKGKLQRGDVIMTTRGTIGNVAHYSANVPFEHVRINSGMVILRTNREALLDRFLFQYLRSGSFRKQIESLRTGAAQPQLPIRDIKTIGVPIPAITTQLRIADILSAYDDLIENNRRRIALLEQAARQLYREWFVRFRFPDHESTRIVDGLPEGWEKANLGDIVSISKGKNITKGLVRDGHVPVVAGGLSPAYYHDTPNVLGPVVTISASGANAGHVNIYHEDIWASDCSFISASQTERVFYFYLLLRDRQQEILGLQRGAAQPHVYPKDLARLIVLIPRDDIVEEFLESVSANFGQMGALNRHTVRLVQGRDLLLPRLMSGKVAV